MSARAQTWYTDFTIGMFIFIVCISLFYKFVPNIERQDLDSIKETYMEAKILSDTLMSDGAPHNWTSDNVKKVGLLTDKNLNTSKLIEFHNITTVDYALTKELFNIRADYAIYFTLANGTLINVSNISVIGHPDAVLAAKRLDLTNLKYSDLMSLTRILRHDRQIIKMVMFVWL